MQLQHASKVLERPHAIQDVECVARAMSHHGCALLVCVEQAYAQGIGNVAADWVSRLLGEVRLHHITSAQSKDGLAAGSSLSCVFTIVT